MGTNQIVWSVNKYIIHLLSILFIYYIYIYIYLFIYLFNTYI